MMYGLDKPTLKDSSLCDILLWLSRQRRRFRVTGLSMLPLLQPGDEILVNCHAYQHRHPQPGDIIIAQHPYKPQTRIVKRVTEVRADGACFVRGDNPAESTDSRAFGWMSSEQILGQVTSRFLWFAPSDPTTLTVTEKNSS
ncbi:MAG: nickel-type superoxide dismutase maturation protease [Microcoleaceae cyanobacterium]